MVIQSNQKKLSLLLIKIKTIKKKLIKHKKKAQNQFLKSNIHLYPPRSKEAQDFPCTVPDKFEKNENETTEKKKRR